MSSTKLRDGVSFFSSAPESSFGTLRASDFCFDLRWDAPFPPLVLVSTQCMYKLVSFPALREAFHGAFHGKCAHALFENVSDCSDLGGSFRSVNTTENLSCLE